jgi:hypothetical protein
VILDIFENGSRIHAQIKRHLTGETSTEPTDGTVGYWESIKTELANFHDVLAAETKLNHPNLIYTGIIDCVSKYANKYVWIINLLVYVKPLRAAAAAAAAAAEYR